MVGFAKRKQPGAIGVDVGQRSVKLVQFNADQTAVLDAVRWDLGAELADAAQRRDQLAEVLVKARRGRRFQGREAILSLHAPQLFVQNIRVAKASGDELDRLVRKEAEVRLPFPLAEADVRFVDAADVKQGDVTRRELILLGCRRAAIDDLVQATVDAGLVPQAVDCEPAALLRCYTSQYRRDEDKQIRVLYVHVGSSNSLVLISRGYEALFIKYVDISGRQMDEAVARHLDMELSEAAALRRHNGDRRADQQDPEVARTVADAIRPIVERLAEELSMCVRYHSVTFRGQPLARLVLSGGEASTTLVDAMGQRVGLRCELGDPLRHFPGLPAPGRKGQWDVAAGLAWRGQP